jgi:hypothetical protein
MTEFTVELRHMCRNPRCRSKLPAPVTNEREAFCARGCHTSFYRKRCLVCEQPMERKTERQLICGKRLCRNGLQARSDLGRYHAPSGMITPIKTSIKPGIKSPLKSDRALPWSVVAAGTPITANQYHSAIVGADLATAESDRINAGHWRTAKAGERGYHRPDSHAAIPGPVPPGGTDERSGDPGRFEHSDVPASRADAAPARTAINAHPSKAVRRAGFVRHSSLIRSRFVGRPSLFRQAIFRGHQ